MTRGSLLRIEDGRNLHIRVWEGELWLTQERDREDLMLGAGQEFRLERDGKTIAYATERCLLTLAAPDPVQYARRLVLVRARSNSEVVLHSAPRRRGWTNLFARNLANGARPTTAAL
jgi:hypothetical protein